MTEGMNKFDKAAAALQGKAHGAMYKKGAAKVNLAAEWAARDLNLGMHNTQQNQK